MPWLARLDASAKQWSAPAHWAYLGLRWFLLLMGVYLVVGLAFTEISEKRVGLGTGVATTLLLASIKGVMLARQRHR